jgi:hypothetical protein
MLNPTRGRAQPVYHIEYVSRLPSVFNGTWNNGTEVGLGITAAWAPPNATAEQIRQKLCMDSKPRLSSKMSTVIKVSEVSDSIALANRFAGVETGRLGTSDDALFYTKMTNILYR